MGMKIVAIQTMQDNAVSDPCADVTTAASHFKHDGVRCILKAVVEPNTRTAGVSVEGTKRKIFIPWSNIRGVVYE